MPFWAPVRQEEDNLPMGEGLSGRTGGGFPIESSDFRYHLSFEREPYAATQ